VTVKIVCDHCRGPVWVEKIDPGLVDLVCLYCGRRDFVKQAKFERILQRHEILSAKGTKKGSLLSVR
jgi:hypothetical protein